MSKTARRKKRLKNDTPETSVPVFVPDIPLPASAVSSSLRACEQPRCRARWSGMNGDMTRDLGDGLSEPVRHVAFEVVKFRPPTVRQIIEYGKSTWDIWPLRFDAPARRAGITAVEVLRCWLCPKCYARAEAMGWAVWAERFWPTDPVADPYDRSASAAGVEAAEYYGVAPMPGVWEHPSGEKEPHGHQNMDEELAPADDASLAEEIATRAGVARDEKYLTEPTGFAPRDGNSKEITRETKFYSGR